MKRACLFQMDPRAELLKRMPKDSVCAEVGVWKGEFSKQILKRTSPQMLHLIDPWMFQPDFPKRKFGGKRGEVQDDMDKIFGGVEARFGKLANVQIHRTFSEETLEGFEDGYLDWLYIDGNHAFEYVLKDLTMGFAKVRPGGFITGDDYTWGKKVGFPVERAVQRFVQEQGLQQRIEIMGPQFIIEMP